MPACENKFIINIRGRQRFCTCGLQQCKWLIYGGPILYSVMGSKATLHVVHCFSLTCSFPLIQMSTKKHFWPHFRFLFWRFCVVEEIHKQVNKQKHFSRALRSTAFLPFHKFCLWFDKICSQWVESVSLAGDIVLLVSWCHGTVTSSVHWVICIWSGLESETPNLTSWWKIVCKTHTHLSCPHACPDIVQWFLLPKDSQHCTILPLIFSSAIAWIISLIF